MSDEPRRSGANPNPLSGLEGHTAAAAGCNSPSSADGPDTPKTCAHCGYILEKIPSERCPECGREYDLYDLGTYDGGPFPREERFPRNIWDNRDSYYFPVTPVNTSDSPSAIGLITRSTTRQENSNCPKPRAFSPEPLGPWDDPARLAFLPCKPVLFAQLGRARRPVPVAASIEPCVANAPRRTAGYRCRPCNDHSTYHLRWSYHNSGNE